MKRFYAVVMCAVLLHLPGHLDAHEVRWKMTTLAGTGDKGYSGDGGRATQANLSRPNSVTLDAAGNMYIADTDNHRVRRVSAGGVITTFAGTGSKGYSGDGGPAVQASLTEPTGVAVDAKGNVYIAERGSYRVRRVSADGTITTFAGTGASGYSGDGGPADRAQLRTVAGLAVDAQGVVYISDNGNHRIRRVGLDGIITTVAGSGAVEDDGGGYSGDGGPANQAWLRRPQGVAVDGRGNLYVADGGNNRIRRVGSDGVITTIAGIEGTPSIFFPVVMGSYSGDGGPATQASMNLPLAVAADDQGTVYIADKFNYVIRRVGSDGVITTFAGSKQAGAIVAGEGPATGIAIDPNGVTVDARGNLYIADAGYQRIRRVEPVPRPASDFDGNYAVDLDDFFLFASAFGKRAPDAGFDVKYDLDRSGGIDFDDFLLFAESFGKKE